MNVYLHIPLLFFSIENVSPTWKKPEIAENPSSRVVGKFAHNKRMSQKDIGSMTSIRVIYQLYTPEI